MITTLSGGAAGVTLLGGTAQGRQDTAHQHHHAHYDLMTDCAHACGETVVHCLNQLREGSQGRDAHAQLAKVAGGCKAFCEFSASLMSCSSPLVHLAHSANAEACRMCAEACEKHSDQSEVVARCAKACRACESACREAAKSTKA
jgi:hypothetical protein